MVKGLLREWKRRFTTHGVSLAEVGGLIILEIGLSFAHQSTESFLYDFFKILSTTESVLS